MSYYKLIFTVSINVVNFNQNAVCFPLWDCKKWQHCQTISTLYYPVALDELKKVLLFAEKMQDIRHLTCYASA